ncbi:DUF1259 domain-containing protein [Marinicrinis sediminis]|uniref:DUF1259 domain-containing protein n=1 Tax=Marinicrinis sediminis TaxID=1652465 RepID=A0ABW5R5Y9_9BACL
MGTAPDQLCKTFTQIIGIGAVEPLAGACETAALRSFPLRIQGVSADLLIAKGLGFSFQFPLDRQGKALCIGQINVRQQELQRVIRSLTRYPDIQIASTPQLFLSSRPRVVSINIQALTKPLRFARIIRQVLTETRIRTTPVRFQTGNQVCKQIATTIRSNAQAFQVNGSCIPRIQRTRPSFILGRRNNSFNNFEYAITPTIHGKPRSYGKSLCLARLWVFQHEIQTVVSRIRKEQLQLGNVSANFLFSTPRSYYITYQTIDDPIRFARKSARIIQGLHG